MVRCGSKQAIAGAFSELHFEEQRLHRLDAPAVVYSDDALYYLRDLNVQRKFACGEFTVDDIHKERNIERRRVLLDRFGLENYVKASKAKVIDISSYGTLYRSPAFNGEEVVIVCVRNSTPEPDGTYKDYFLRVPPNMRTAREAVAWTFNLRPEEYGPERET